MLHLHNLCTLTSNVVQGKDIDDGVEIFFWILIRDNTINGRDRASKVFPWKTLRVEGNSLRMRENSGIMQKWWERMQQTHCWDEEKGRALGSMSTMQCRKGTNPRIIWSWENNAGAAKAFPRWKMLTSNSIFLIISKQQILRYTWLIAHRRKVGFCRWRPSLGSSCRRRGRPWWPGRLRKLRCLIQYDIIL